MIPFQGLISNTSSSLQNGEKIEHFSQIIMEIGLLNLIRVLNEVSILVEIWNSLILHEINKNKLFP